MKTDNAMHKMSITAPTAVKEAINMVSSDPSSGIEIVVELSVIVVLRDHPFKTLANFTLFLTHTPLPSALCNYYLGISIHGAGKVVYLDENSWTHTKTNSNRVIEFVS